MGNESSTGGGQVQAYCKPIIRKLRLQNPICPAGFKDDPCLTRTSRVQCPGFAQASALTLSSLPIPILLLAVFSAHDKIHLPRLSRH